jgi:glycosyltransferase involved in cell wall biosynthesis
VLADTRSFHTERYVRELRGQGCRVVVASLERGKIIHVHLRRIGPISQLHYFFAIRQVRKLIARFEPDIVNAHFATGYGWLAARAIARQWRPMVLHLWGSDILQVPGKSPLHRRKAASALKSAALVIADSSYLMEEARNIQPIDTGKIIYWGLERKYLALSDTERKFVKPLRIIMPRHHEPIYNNSFALRALAPLLKSGEIALTVPNWGSLVSQFRKACAALEVRSVTFYDRLLRDRYMQLLSGHDVYLSASLSDSSPASLIEACGLGLVPICMDIPGVREWINPASGFLIRMNDEESLRQVIGRIIASGDSCQRLRVKNHERVKRDAVFENSVADTIGAMMANLEKKG